MTGVKLKPADRWKYRPSASTHITNEARAPVEQARVDREPQVDYAVAYRARIRELGDDGLKEEPKLRALEAVVNLYRSHHPDADVDTAKAAVLDAIKEAAS